MPSVTCPTFFVHGQQDKLISFTHSQEMLLKCGGPVSIVMPPNMDHNDFNFMGDLILPFFNFLKQLGITTEAEQGQGHFKFPEFIYLPPGNQQTLG